MNLREDFLKDSRFQGITSFQKQICLSSPTMHGDEQYWINDAISKNWVSTVGENIEAIEVQVAAKVGRKYAVALSTGTASLHLAIRLAGERLYGARPAHVGSLRGHKVFASDCTFDATVNPIAYEDGEPIFIDMEPDSWNISPEALEKAFEKYPDVKLIVLAHLYGTPGKCDEIRKIADAHGALIVEDAAESLGSFYKGVPAGNFGDYSILSFNGNKIITGSAGGMFLTDQEEDAVKIRKWSTQSRENAPWYQHAELGYNYRMSNLVAGVIRGQLPYLEEHVERKKEIYEQYKKDLKDLPISMNPFEKEMQPNHWLSCMVIHEEAMCEQIRTDISASYKTVPGKSCPTEILAALNAFHVEGRPIWKPMHLQPLYREYDFITSKENSKDNYGEDIFRRGICLPSDHKMTSEQQKVVTDIIHRCFL